MGIDWQTKCAPTWTLAWSKAHSDLCVPGLFPAIADESERTFRARMQTVDGIKSGEVLIARRRGNAIVLEKGNAEIGTIECAPVAVLDCLTTSKSDVTTCVVRELYEVSNCVDVFLQD